MSASDYPPAPSPDELVGRVLAGKYKAAELEVSHRFGDVTTLTATQLDLGADRAHNSPAHLFSLKGAAPLAAGASTVASRLRAEAPRLVRDGTSTRWALLWDLTLTGAIRVVDVGWAIGVRDALDGEVLHPTGGDLRMTTVPQPGRTLFASVSAEL